MIRLRKLSFLLFSAFPFAFSLLPSHALAATANLANVAAADAADSGDEAAYDLRAHYTKYEYRIPMRDGAKLFTAVY
ncbi:hypothetical protein, partial [Undibacterium sp.]|uniref:hypothetical protein n=1 Tax=Undibacterium sp. TaxID=1914977 RepID=UPI00374DE9DC